MVFHVLQFPARPTILVKLHLESQLVHASDEVGIDNTPLPDVVDIAIGPLVLRMNCVEVLKIGSVRFFTRGMRNVAKVLVSAKVEQPRRRVEVRVLLIKYQKNSSDTSVHFQDFVPIWFHLVKQSIEEEHSIHFADLVASGGLAKVSLYDS